MFTFLVNGINGGIVSIFNLFGCFNLGSLRLFRLPCFKLFINSISDKSVFRYGFNILDRFDTLVNDLSQGLPAEIEARQQQYEYYRDQLLTFKRKEA